MLKMQQMQTVTHFGEGDDVTGSATGKQQSYIYLQKENRIFNNNNIDFPKVCSADHWWSARLAEVVREALKQINILSFTDHQMILSGPRTKIFWEPLI